MFFTNAIKTDITLQIHKKKGIKISQVYEYPTHNVLYNIVISYCKL